MSSGCHYLPDLIAVHPDDLEEAVKALTRIDGLSFENPFDPSTYRESSSSEADSEQEKQVAPEAGPGDYLSDLSPSMIQRITATVAFIRVSEDPHAVATRLAGHKEPVRASAVHGLGRLNHISAMQGTEPKPATAPAAAIGGSHYPDPYGVVAVVDSGVAESIPDWLSDGLRFDDPLDIDRAGSGSGSHGTFVAGIIRSISPNHIVSIARAGNTPIELFAPKGASGGAQFLVTELDVLAAIVRLVERHAGDDVDALNLSLGGFSCGDGDPAMLTLSLAIDYWRQHFPRSPVFAAGGNTDDPRPVYPGAFNHVRSVAAAGDGSGKQVVWNFEKSPPAIVPSPSDRPWVTDIAPGVELMGPSGRGADDWIKWSGSSFACAVAAACYSSRRPFHSENDRVLWCDPSVSYDAIPGLNH